MEQKKNELQIANGKQHNNTIEKSLSTAIKTKRINECWDSEVQDQLSKIYVLIGLRSIHYPQKDVAIFNIQFIKQNFGNRTIGEIYLAFELAITGKSDCGDVKPYDQFTMEYFSRIMNGYRTYLNHNTPITQLEAEISTKKEIPMLPTTPQSEVIEWSEMPLRKYSLYPLYLYDVLMNGNFITLSAEERFSYIEKAIKVLLSEIEHDGMNYENYKTNNKYKKYLERGVHNLTKDELKEFTNVAKKLVIYEYFKARHDEKSKENGCQPQTDYLSIEEITRNIGI